MEDGGVEDSLPDFGDSFGRQRSNSDPLHRDNKIVMNGKNTVPKSRAPSYLKATGQDEKNAPRMATPPPSRKNKFAASISRLFRPWKWRRKRKSERFIATSENLERQLSVRAKREELVKKGILPPAIGSLPEDDHITANSSNESATGTQMSSEGENTSASAVCAQKEASLRGILKASPLVQRAAVGTRELQIRQIDQSNMMDQLSQKLANRTSESYTSQEVTDSDEQLGSCSGVTGQTNAQWTMVVNVQSTDNSRDNDKENSGVDVMHHEDEDSSDEEEECGIVTQLASKLKRTDSLALKLKVRPSKVELEEKNILHSKSEVQTQEQRAEVGSKLVRRLSSRPTAHELRERNILKSSSEEEEKVEREEKKKVLTRKLSRRPTIQELKARKILKFSEYVESGECHDYDRRADKPWTRLTPEDKAAIRKELNEYKSAEMEVHEDSRQYTRFHRP